MKMKTKIHENAVSPVVGVMLMLVVTIIIAALVSSFAGGLGTQAEVTPTATFDVDITLNPNANTQTGPMMTLKHLGGDTLDTKDLQVITEYTVPSKCEGRKMKNAGKTIKHTIDGSLTMGKENEWDPGLDPFTTPQVNNPAYALTMNSMSVENRFAFGTGLWRPGQVIQSDWAAQTVTGPTTGASEYAYGISRVLGFDVTDIDAYGFTEGTNVHVTIVHKPSGRFIYDKDVKVVW